MLRIGIKTEKQDPEETESAAELRLFNKAFHGGRLLAKGKVFKSQIEILFQTPKYI
jgi:hypothetical protein